MKEQLAFYKKFTKDVGIVGLSQLLTILGAIILLPILTKTLGAHGYGIWVQVMVTVSLVVSIVSLGLPFAMVRFIAAEKNKREIQEGFYSIITVTFFAALVVSSLLIMLLGLIANSLFEGETSIVKLIAIIIPIWGMHLTCSNYFRAFRQMGRLLIFGILVTLGEVGLIGYLVLTGHGIFSAVLSILIVRVVITFVMLCLIVSEIGIKLPNFSRIKEYLSFSLPLIPNSLSEWALRSSDRYIISLFLGVVFVGFYSPGYALGSLISVFPGILTYVLVPTLSKLYDEGKINEVKIILKYSLRYILMLAIPFFFGASLLSKPLLNMFSTPEIASQGHLVTPFIALSALFSSAFIVMAQALLLVKKTKIIAFTWGISASANLLLNILIVPYLGILGAAITTLIAYSLALGITTYYSFQELRFDIEWTFIIKSLVASGIMALTIWPIYPQSNLNTIIAVLAGVAVYGLALFLLKGFRKEEIRFFKKLFQRV